MSGPTKGMWLAQQQANQVGKYPLPPDFYSTVAELIKRDTVGSVSCPLADVTLWRMLVGEQVRRSQSTGLPLQRAFFLSGPDSALEGIPIEDWGGKVHIPYEGACAGDLFIKPGWRFFFVDKGETYGRLTSAIGCQCHYVLTWQDFGEVSFANRIALNGWVLYESRSPYKPYQHFSESLPPARPLG